MEDLLKIFKIKKPHAIKGEVKATLLINIKNINKLLNKLMFIQVQMMYTPVTLIKITATKQDYILKFKEFTNINEVISFKECYLFGQKTDLNYAEVINQENLINFTVFHSHKKIGVLVNQFETKAHLVFEIKTTDGTLMMIPNVDAYVEQVDLQQQKIILKRMI
ncbi:ribosome maturation factor RimM [Spiroplasma melliferum]|uniref:16S rRNA-processing protein RimM n=2 Tax=Spiroplasma melliferum TaxID=2134 RepID=A0AAI9X0P6_SPIME|nr:ribosome maturation factor RimM [Spiroplasma melliferum]ELL44288.1 16S rRNA-processing protein RimM [Spiroplasma melliferum IPMB4A]KAI92125.1 16S rRNA-processing protein RimM [Spiroplasma melliferum KC3]QCO23537.1 16S rRNA processing protein [Spiroplasma melliferum]